MSSPCMYNVCTQAVATIAGLGTTAWLLTRFSHSKSIDLTLKKPYWVQRKNYFLFDWVKVCENNGKLVYEGTHVKPVEFNINRSERIL